MREVAIYFVRDDGDHMAFLCLGGLFDHLREHGYKIVKGRKHEQQRVIQTPTGEVIMYRREILSCSNEEFGKLLKSDVVSIAKSFGDSSAWSIYKIPGVEETWGVDRRKEQTSETAMQFAEKRTHVAEVRQLDVKQIPELSFPVTTYMQRDNRGRLFCRINLHPDLDGTTDIGKLCFPDRGWTNISEGEVSVTACDELNSYCFVRGEMVKYAIPDRNVVAAWVGNNLKSSATIFVVSGSLHGDYIGYCDQQAGEYRRITVVDGVVSTSLFYQMMEDLDTAEVKTYTPADFVLTVMFSDVYSTVEDIAKGFAPCEFSRIDGRKERQLGCEWQATTAVSGVSDLLLRAIKTGIVYCDNMEGYNIVTLSVVKENFAHLASFTKEEVKALAEEVSDFNEKSSEIIITLLKAGKLRLLITM